MHKVIGSIMVCALLSCVAVPSALPEPGPAGDAASGQGNAKRPPVIPAGIVEKEGKFFCVKDGAEMVYVPEGSFLLGAKDQKESPPVRVYLGGYFIDRFEATNAQYRKFAEGTERPAPRFSERGAVRETWKDLRLNAAEQPVVGVSWQDAADYCKWAGKQLPTQAQWEKAARGTDGRKYPWGDESPEDAQGFRANYSQMTRPGQQNAGDGYLHTSPVGKFERDRSPYGAMDMAGNVSEWCSDWFSAADPDKRETTDPRGPETGDAKVIRGGNWQSSMQFGDPLRCTEIQFQKPGVSASNLGFRCVIPVPAQKPEK
jgi:formylglycine-generating enzyme required for sulfatase activity